MSNAVTTKRYLKILMIEDSRPDVFFYSDMLKKSFGKSVEINNASRLRIANRYMRKNRYDLVLLDLNIIDSDGVETVKNFRKEFGAEIPLIVLTGLKDAEVRIQALLAGADDYLVKGRDDETLCKLIVNHTFERYELVKRGHQDKRFV